VVLIALAGPVLAGSPTTPVGPPFQPPSAEHLLGTDTLGRDVLNRVMAGGWPVIVLATGATAAATGLGTVIGTLTVLAGRRAGEMVFRGLDVLVVIPAVLLLLVLATGFPASNLAVLVAVALTTTPLSARVVRAAALRVVGAGYVEVALSRGDSKLMVLTRDILPNISGPVLADSGLRFAAAVYLTSTAGFLGLGAGAPAPNWGRMVAENLPGASLTIWPTIVPALLLVLFTVSVNLLTDEVAHRTARGNP
jgi:peptide/nickel transport system permease protein